MPPSDPPNPYHNSELFPSASPEEQEKSAAAPQPVIPSKEENLIAAAQLRAMLRKGKAKPNVAPSSTAEAGQQQDESSSKRKRASGEEQAEETTPSSANSARPASKRQKMAISEDGCSQLVLKLDQFQRWPIEARLSTGMCGFLSMVPELCKLRRACVVPLFAMHAPFANWPNPSLLKLLRPLSVNLCRLFTPRHRRQPGIARYLAAARLPGR